MTSLETNSDAQSRIHSDAHQLAQALISAASSGDPREALRALRAERQHVLQENHGDKEVTRAMMKEIRREANQEATQYERSNHLPIVVFHARSTEDGRKVAGIGRQNNQQAWEEWNPRSKSWEPVNQNR